MQNAVDQILSDYPNPTLALDHVIEYLTDAARLFAAGEAEQACLRLEEANSVLELCSAEATFRSLANRMAPRSAEAEKAPAALIA